MQEVRLDSLSAYITEYVISGRGRKRNVSPKLSDLKTGDMVRIKSKEDILDMVTIRNGEMRFYYDKDRFLYISDEMLEMCGDVCEVIDKTSVAVMLHDKKFPNMECFWTPELLEEI